MEDAESSPGSKRQALLEGARLKGLRAREFFSRQLMLPEWMVDIPPYLKKDWYYKSYRRYFCLLTPSECVLA